jgi:hypothetical protein
VTTPQLPPPVDASELLKAFEVLGIQFSTGLAAGTKEDLVLSLSHGLIGAAEQHAMRAEQASRAAGATIADIGEATGQAFNAAGCRSVTDDIALLSWRAQRQAQAVGVVNENNPPDELMKTVQLVAAALSGLLSTAQTMRNPLRGARDTKDAARAVRASAAALDRALTSGPGLKVLADLLDTTDSVPMASPDR